MKTLILGLSLLILAASAYAQDLEAGTVEILGQRYQLLLRPLTPPPPPVNRSVWGAQHQDGTWTREARAGDILRLIGEGFGESQGQAWIAGLPAEVIAWSAAVVTVRLPPVQRVEVGQIRLKSNGWEIASPFDVSISPRIGPDPPPPVPGQLPVLTGREEAPGAPVRLLGSGFGSARGTVYQDGVPVEVVHWREGEIIVTARSGRAGSLWSVIRADGKYYQSGGVGVVMR